MHALLPQQTVRETVLSWSFPAAVAPWTLRGTSRSAQATSFFIPELAWSLDAGALVFTQRPERVLLTHTHSDHASLLTHHKSRRKPPDMTVPAHAVPLVEAYLDAAQILTSSAPKPEGFEWTEAYRLQGVLPGDRIVQPDGNRALVIDIIRCDHSIPCVGYIVARRTRRLRPELRHLPGPALADLRRSGAEVHEEEDTPLFAFLGDTTPRVYDWHPELLRCPVIIGECTFLDPAHRDDAWARYHTHWDDLSPIIRANPQTTFVVTHFSLRYRAEQIRSFFHAIDLPNLVPWIGADDVR